MSSKREVIESPQEQGEDERIPYTLVTTPWGGSPTSPVCTLKLVSPDNSMSNITATNLSGSPSVAGDNITSGVVFGLTADSKYRLEFKWTNGSKVLEAFMIIYCRV
jgi:hypothetical protein